MTEERQAIKTLAEELVKAMKSVNKTSSQKAMGTSGTVLASKIVGLPAAFSSIISGIEESAAAGDAVAQQILTALNHIAAGEFETITADTAMIDKVYATFGDFVNLIAENAVIGDLDVESIRASMGIIGLLTLTTADIQQAQIDHLSADNAFLRYGVGGKLYIDDLAVSNANIVNLAAGTILLNNSNGDLVELYVDATTGDITTRAVSYDGSDIINQNSLNGNRIVQNSITTTQLNASEIFAYQGMIMDLIADNIEASRLFANQGFIQQLQTTIISSDLSNNPSFISLADSISLVASNSSKTFIQDTQPLPVHASDTWFDPSTEEHYVVNVALPPMTFGHDNDGNLCIVENDDYQFEINANGELMMLVVNEEAEQLIIDNNIDFSIVDDCVYANGLWKKIENVAFSRLSVSVDGIVAEVEAISYDIYDPTTGESRIAQNSTRIDQNSQSITLTAQSLTNVTNGTTAVPYVETSSIKIKNDKIEIKSTGDVDIKADKFSIAFNTVGHLANTSRVEISDSSGIKVSDSYGNYFQATSTKIGLYDIQNNARLYMDNNGNAIFAGSLSAATGTFAGSLSAATGTFAGSLSANCIQGGTLTLGGQQNGALSVLNAAGQEIGTWTNDGINVTKGDIDLDYSGSIKVGFNESGTRYALFNNSGMHLELENGSNIYTIPGNLNGQKLVTVGHLILYYGDSSEEYECEFSPGALVYSHKYINESIDYMLRYDYDGLLVMSPDYNMNFNLDSGLFYVNIERTNIHSDTIVNGEFYVLGTKSRIVSTSQYSDRLLYCYETPSPLFGDVGEGQISSDGKCYISLDAVFAQTISTDQYQVFLQKYGDGDCYVSERHGSYFVVTGTPNLQFGWELKAKQSDYDQLRLERNDEKFKVPSQSYGEDAVKHIRELYSERIEENEEESEE